MEMYPKNDLYNLYKKNVHDDTFSPRIPDLTKRRTVEFMNFAINCCESWGTSLDVGGGSGHYSIPLLYKFKKVIVAEVTKYEEHKYLKNKYKNFEYYNDFIENIQLREKVDFILLADIFEHIIDIDLFIEQMGNLQSKDGIIYILTPNPLFCGPAEQSGIYYALHKDGHRKHYLKEEVTKIMYKHNYEMIYTGHEEGPLRQTVKRILKGFSRRDRILNNKFFIYRKVIAPVLEILYSPLLLVIESFVYMAESNLKNNSEVTMATTYIFKKI